MIAPTHPTGGTRNPPEKEDPLQVTLSTTKGDIQLRLFADRAPMTVANFINLARRGFYDGVVFHRVIDDFMIQGGDPTGTGTGGPGYKFDDEFVGDLRHDKPGVLSMANAGPGTNGSQFFITEVPTPHLDNKHTIFGQCEEIDIVKRIAREGKGQKVKLQRVTIARDG